MGELIVGVGIQSSWFINNFTEIVDPIVWININDISHLDVEVSHAEGVLLGLKICKEMFAQGQLTHENIYENEIIYKEHLQNLNNG